MTTMIYDWFELERLEKAAIEGELLDIDLAEIRRNKLIMYLCYKEKIDREQKLMLRSFWDIISKIDSDRALLAERFGEEAVMEVERCTVETAAEIERIEESLNATWEMFAPPMKELKVDENGNLVPDDDGSVAENDSIEELAKRMNLSDKHISAIGLAACAEGSVTGEYEREPGESAEHRASVNYEKFANRLVHRNDPFSPKMIACLHNLSARALREAMKDYVNGNPKKLGNLLRAGIKKTCEMFADARDPEDAAKRAGQLKEMLDVIEINPKLNREVDLNQEERNAAYGAVVMGDTIVKGLKSLNRLQNAGLSNTELSEDVKTECMTDILQMQIVLNDRNKQIEVFKGREPIKNPPTDMQKSLGTGATVSDLKNGKWPGPVEKMRLNFLKAKAFKRQVVEPTFQIARRMGNGEQRESIAHSVILEAQKGVESMKTMKKVPDVSMNKKEAPVIGGPALTLKSDTDRK